MRIFYAFKAILSMWAVGIPIRFIVEYFRGSIYVPCLFDVGFDWIPLLTFGVLVFIESVYKFYKSCKSSQDN